LSLAAGSVVEVHGNLYTYGNIEGVKTTTHTAQLHTHESLGGGKMKITANGTRDLPIFVRGIANDSNSSPRSFQHLLNGLFLVTCININHYEPSFHVPFLLAVKIFLTDSF
jgi:hypothetical protein